MLRKHLCQGSCVAGATRGARPVHICRALRGNVLRPVTLCRAASSRSTSTALSSPAFTDTDLADVEEAELRQDAARPRVDFVSLVDGVHTVRGSLQLEMRPEEVYSLLTEYESSHEVFANISSSEVIRSEAGVEVIQGCKWSFLAFSGSFKVHLGVVEDPHQRTLVFNLAGGSNFMRSFQGRWAVHPVTLPGRTPSVDHAAASGASVDVFGAEGGFGEQAVGCVVEHVLSVAPAVPVPPPVSFYTRGIFMRQVERVLLDLQEEVGRRRAAAQ